MKEKEIEEVEENEEEDEDDSDEETGDEEETTSNEEKEAKEDRQMWEATCSECGTQTQVPFKPDPSRPVYCRDCFMKKRKRSFSGGGRSGGFSRGGSFNRGFNRNRRDN